MYVTIYIIVMCMHFLKQQYEYENVIARCIFRSYSCIIFSLKKKKKSHLIFLILQPYNYIERYIAVDAYYMHFNICIFDKYMDLVLVGNQCKECHVYVQFIFIWVNET